MKNKFGVPCSKIQNRIKDVDVFCTSEEQAMALSAGCWLATGEKAEVYMQNSGLARCVDIVTSLYLPYNIPLPKTIISVRNKPHHHSFIGKITKDLLKLIDYDNAELVIQE
jgi:sulfopyruvate decarboxylase TPP-binding subunit